MNLHNTLLNYLWLCTSESGKGNFEVLLCRKEQGMIQSASFIYYTNVPYSCPYLSNKPNLISPKSSISKCCRAMAKWLKHQEKYPEV
jgi:hypothetical protein